MKSSKLLMLLGATFMGLSQVSFSQTATEWKSLTELPEIKVQFKYQNCNNPKKGMEEELVFLQMQNTLNVPIKVSWEEELKYNGKCFNCAGGNPEFKREITLKAGETITAQCAGTETISQAFEKSPLRIFSKFVNVPGAESKLTDFKLKNFKIDRIN